MQYRSIGPATVFLYVVDITAGVSSHEIAAVESAGFRLHPPSVLET